MKNDTAVVRVSSVKSTDVNSTLEDVRFVLATNPSVPVDWGPFLDVVDGRRLSCSRDTKMAVMI